MIRCSFRRKEAVREKLQAFNRRIFTYLQIFLPFSQKRYARKTQERNHEVIVCRYVKKKLMRTRGLVSEVCCVLQMYHKSYNCFLNSNAKIVLFRVNFLLCSVSFNLVSVNALPTFMWCVTVKIHMTGLHDRFTYGVLLVRELRELKLIPNFVLQNLVWSLCCLYVRRCIFQINLQRLPVFHPQQRERTSVRDLNHFCDINSFGRSQ